jgi:hypothetical protein
MQESTEGWINFTRKILLAASFVALLTGAVRMKARESEDAGRKEIEAFNRRYVELHLKMDTAGVLALWEEDGVDLMPGYKVTKQDMEFHDIRVCWDWASEWASEHQVVQPPEGKPPIEGYGKMALVLHREANGEWKVQQEMWNVAPKP